LSLINLSATVLLQTADRHARWLAYLAIQRLVFSSSHWSSAAARPFFAVVWGVGGAASDHRKRREGDTEVVGLSPWLDGPLPLGRTSSQFSRISVADAETHEPADARTKSEEGAEPASGAQRLAYEMYVGFSVGRAEDQRPTSGRGALLVAALSNSSSSSLWYTRWVILSSI
jgi:hypothetical protein